MIKDTKKSLELYKITGDKGRIMALITIPESKHLKDLNDNVSDILKATKDGDIIGMPAKSNPNVKIAYAVGTFIKAPILLFFNEIKNVSDWFEDNLEI